MAKYVIYFTYDIPPQPGLYDAKHQIGVLGQHEVKVDDTENVEEKARKAWAGITDWWQLYPNASFISLVKVLDWRP